MATTGRQPRPHRKKEKQDEAGSFPLTEEVRAYETHLPEWSDREGQFVLIKGRDILGFYPGHEQALDAGYDQLGSGPFLVKQIVVPEPIYRLGHIDP